MTSLLTTIRAYQRALLGARKSALYDLHPELREVLHLSSSYADRISQESDNYVGNAERFRSYVWVRKAVTLIAQTIAPLPVRVVDSQGKAIANHPLTLLYANPNDTMPGPEFRGISTVHLLLGGERATEIVDDAGGRPRELWPRRPDRVSIRPDASRPGYPRAAQYVLSDLVTSSYDGAVPAEAVIFEKFTNPLSDWRGLSPISAIIQGIQIALLAQAQRKLFYKNNARVEYALVAAEALSPDERKRIETQVDEKYGAGQGTGKPMILEFGQDIKTISYPPKDLRNIEDQGLTADEVAAIFGIPDILMGFGNDSYDTQEKRDAALSVLWALTLLPLVGQHDQTETHFWTTVRPLLRSGERVATDFTGVAVLQEDLGPKLELAVKLFGMGVPFNVIDKQLKLGLGAIPGGETGYLPMNLIPTDQPTAPADPTPTPASGTASATPEHPILGYHIEQGVVSRNEARAQLGLPSEDETLGDKLRRLQAQLSVALMATNVGIDVNQALALVGIDLVVEPTAPALPAPVLGQASAPGVTKGRRPAAARIGAALQRTRLQLVGRMAPAVDRYFADLAERIVARARGAEKAVYSGNGHGVVVKLPTVADLLLHTDETALKQLFTSFTLEICRASWGTWNDALGVAIAFEQSDPAVVAALGQSGRRVAQITDVTRQALVSVLEVGASEGWTLDQLVGGVGDNAGLRDVVEESYRGRARTIARTELGEAQGTATCERYHAVGVSQVVIFDGGSDDSDDACNQLNGTVQTLHWYRQNLLGHPSCTRAAGAYYGD